MNKEQKLRKQSDKIRKELDKIETKKRINTNKKYLGKCFKGENSYGNNEPKWWLYKKVIGVDYDLESIQFQITSNGTYEIESNKWCNDLSYLKEISQEEFNQAWLEFKISVANLDNKLYKN
jgi:hypothetical protein